MLLAYADESYNKNVFTLSALIVDERMVVEPLRTNRPFTSF
jgi:hypothetical protein